MMWHTFWMSDKIGFDGNYRMIGDEWYCSESEAKERALWLKSHGYKEPGYMDEDYNTYDV